jgi:hypothetical protein
MIAVAIASVACTISTEMALGSMCDVRITCRRTPTARAASTKSFSRCASTDERSSRAKIGMLTIPTATMICQSPGCSAATIAIAKSSPGIASITSMIRISTESTKPPKYPATPPITIPIESPMNTETTPMRSE